MRLKTLVRIGIINTIERTCEVEKVTNQILEIDWVDGEFKVVKRFGY